MKYLKEHVPLIAIFCLALLVRLIYNKTVAHGYVAEFDAGLFETLAKSVLTSHCYCLFPHEATTNRAPAWAFVIAAIYSITGANNVYPRLFLCFLGSGTCALIYLFAKDLFGTRVAFITGALAAIYTGLFIYDGWLYAESLYTFFLLAFIYSLYKLQRTSQYRWMITGGISLGIASMARPNGPILFGLMCIWAVVMIRAKIVPWQTMARAFAIILVLAALIIAPWTWRNYRVTHTFILVSGGSGVVLSGSYNDTTLQDNPMGRRGLWIPLNFIASPPIDINRCCEYKTEAYNTQYALGWIHTHPRKLPYLMSLHFINLWVPYTSEAGLPMIQFPERPASQFVWKLMNIMPYPIYLLALAGLLVTWKRLKSRLLLVHLVILFAILQALAFYGSSRFRAPIEPFLILLAGGAIWWLSSSDPGTLRSWRAKKSTAVMNAEKAVPVAISSAT